MWECGSPALQQAAGPLRTMFVLPPCHFLLLSLVFFSLSPSLLPLSLTPPSLPVSLSLPPASSEYGRCGPFDHFSLVSPAYGSTVTVRRPYVTPPPVYRIHIISGVSSDFCFVLRFVRPDRGAKMVRAKQAHLPRESMGNGERASNLS